MASFLGRPSVGASVTQEHIQSIVEFGMVEAEARLVNQDNRREPLASSANPAKRFRPF